MCQHVDNDDNHNNVTKMMMMMLMGHVDGWEGAGVWVVMMVMGSISHYTHL